MSEKEQAKLGTQAKVKRQPTDWDRIKLLYRANTLSMREIGAMCNVSHVSISKRIKADEAAGNPWPRDLAEAIAKKADELVTRREVTSVVTSAAAERKVVTDKVIIEANAEVIATVRINHRSDIRRFRNIALQILGELEHQTENNALYVELGVLLRSEDRNGKDRLNDIYHAVIAMPDRVDALKKLAETLKILVGLEREAYGIGNAADDPGANKYNGPALSAQEAYQRMLNGHS